MWGGVSFSSVISLHVGTTFVVSGVGQGDQIGLQLIRDFFKEEPSMLIVPSIIDIFCFLPISESFKIRIVENL